ncbi:type II secretion system protein GspG [Pseudenhygromyxa sp. WMMC2535]|uniref:type II secretion system protein GspG n=1 Tax=Pseudenhygromyxa sp. WMMC2535 TaxID=2712867 RepID=UPI0015564B91|nr:type II secretion system protein GspG [Pseudenhygromyxa sp. WMMC2535]NVB36714.1 type II secretion system protein GspG [Pseudenhygromyxa sp. WMMC2535]
MSTLVETRKQAIRKAASRGTRGMTLIEILVVLAIIGLIMGGVAVVASNALGNAKVDTAKKDIVNLETSIEMYQIQRNDCPKSVEDLKAAGIIKKVTKDPWGQPYEIKCPGEHGSVDITSGGKDKTIGTEDDVNSWDEDKPEEEDK